MSADQFMPAIEIPTLILNAENDPLLEKDCYPFALAQKKPEIHLEVPARGGHTGFMLPGEPLAYSETRLAEFVAQF
ncbi:alpha/beta fold hydrolase family protein [Nitritalea halalkaliphila]|uniref:hypothetical protein n=1 Tax=Nitritalea halalkaliphila TaxID=590849 RepID=UPI0002D6FB71|nr:hypothetical protein [Nitritalea halalkaliphila]